MSKCIRDGKVAILYSPGFGAGWSTWNNDEYREFLLHDEKLVELVETVQKHKIEQYVETVYPDKNICLLGWTDLKVEWVSSGTQFRITEYDGSESIVYSRCEEAYKRVYGFYPETYEDSWSAFQNGYNASQVIETPQEPEELKTLYQMFYDEGWTKSCDEFCDIVKNWLPTERVENKYDADYNSGWNDLLDTLRRTLR